MAAGGGAGSYLLDSGSSNNNITNNSGYDTSLFCNHHRHHHIQQHQLTSCPGEDGGTHPAADPLGLHTAAGGSDAFASTAMFRERVLEMEMDMDRAEGREGGQMGKHEWEENI
jgi:hypothetical protein